jgi:hypothetical protein
MNGKTSEYLLHLLKLAIDKIKTVYIYIEKIVGIH